MLSRLGFPEVGEHRRFVAALGIDAIGSGVWTPLSLLYFLTQTDLSLVNVGLALSIGSLATLPLVPLAGQLVDALGSKRLLQVGNLVQAAGFAAYPFVHSLGAVILAVLVTCVGRTLFWGSYGPLITAITRPGERERWFGFLHAMRNAGFGIGGLLAAAAVTIGTAPAYHAVVLGNAASYLFAWWLLRVLPGDQHAAVAAPVVGGWRAIARDRGYRWLIVTNFGYAMAGMVLTVVMPVYFVTLLDLPGWMPGTVYVVNTVMIGLGQGLVVHRMTGVIRTRVVLSAVLFTVLGYAGMWSAAALPVTAAVGVVLVAAVLYTLGEMSAGPVLGALAAEAAPAELRGRYMSVVQLSWTTASAVAPLLYAAMLHRGVGVTWAGLLILAGLWALCCVPLRRRLPLAALRVTNRAEVG